MKTSRRHFLASSGCGISAAALLASLDRLGQVSAMTMQTPAANDYRALVCIFLYGGNDANNMIIPHTNYAEYNAVRGPNSGINIPQASLLKIAAPSHGADFGLHPNMSGMQTLYNQGHLAVLCNTGPLARPLTRSQYLGGAPRPANLFSHSDQQSQWQSARTATITNAPTGWGGRTADATAGLNGGTSFPMVISTAGISLFTTGQNARPLVPGTNLAGFPNPPDNDARYKSLRAIMAMNTGGALTSASNTINSAAIDNVARLNAATSGGVLATAFPNTTLGNQLRQIALIIRARGTLGLKRQIFFASLGGFDNHTNQLAAQGSLLLQVSQAMKAFYDATVEMGVAAQVTSFTLSDFGRTFQAAAGAPAGSDHAWGNHQLLMGDAVRGGNFHGRFPTLKLQGPDDASSEGRWIPTTAVDQLGATLARWYGLPDTALAAVFPNLSSFLTPDLGFMM
ncbi:MAG: DUF1501 domain-containing protein [Blastocatellia bacterium]